MNVLYNLTQGKAKGDTATHIFIKPSELSYGNSDINCVQSKQK